MAQTLDRSNCGIASIYQENGLIYWESKGIQPARGVHSGRDVSTTRIHTQVMARPGLGVGSPLDEPRNAGQRFPARAVQRRPNPPKGQTLFAEPGIRIWTSSNDLAQSRCRAASAPQVPGCQWDALNPLGCCCQVTRIRQPAMPSLSPPLSHAGPTGASP